MRNDLTQDTVKALFTYGPEEGLLRWRNPAGRYNRFPAGKTAGALNGEGYRYVNIRGRPYRAARLIWLWMTGSWPKHQIDHVDVDPANDKWANLREASSSENKRNCKRYVNNTSGCKCVFWEEDRKMWTVKITVDGKRKRLGRWKTKEEAVAAYLAAVGDLHGDFANSGNL